MKEIAEILQRTKSHNRTVCPIRALERTYEGYIFMLCCSSFLEIPVDALFSAA